jgi:hypothetical protein
MRFSSLHACAFAFSGCASSAVALLICPSTATAQPAAPDQRISVTAYGCVFSGAKAVNVFLQDARLPVDPGRNISIPAEVGEDGALHFEFHAPPGVSYVDYGVDGQQCRNGGSGLVVLPAHDRHVLALMHTGNFIRDWHGRKFVTGTVGPVPVSISLVYSDADGCPTGSWREIAATIDGGAYYAGYAYGRHMFLELREAFETLYIALPDAAPARSNRRFVKRDITAEDLRALGAHGRATTCIDTPSGIST